MNGMVWMFLVSSDGKGHHPECFRGNEAGLTKGKPPWKLQSERNLVLTHFPPCCTSPLLSSRTAGHSIIAD